MSLHRLQLLAASLVWIAASATSAQAITTSMGQAWNFAPDAWTRGNTTDTSYFGWDVLEAAGPPTGPFGSFRLDDVSPDLGAPTTAASTRIRQSDASLAVYGHRSGTGNYYSGFQGNAFADDTISANAPTPAGQSGGFTTVVLQVIGQPGSTINDLTFTMDDRVAAWTKQKDLYGLVSGAGVYWQEWTAPGANLPLAIHMTSSSSSRGIDAFQFDTHWSAVAPVVNAITAIPEPSSLALAAIGLLAAAKAARRPRLNWTMHLLSSKRNYHAPRRQIFSSGSLPVKGRGPEVFEPHAVND